MYIYTHLVTASQMEPVLRPADRHAYYLGAIVPDLRYMAGIPRDGTHLPLRDIAAWLERYPHLHDFILGYLVHCALDELEIRQVVFRKLPLAPVQSLMRRKLAHTLLETYYIDHTVVTICLPEYGNEILDRLGLTEPLVCEFTGWLNRFLREPSFEMELEFLREALFSSGNPRFRRLMGPLLAFQRSPTLKRLLWLSFDPPYFEAAISRYLLSDEDVGSYIKIRA